MASEKKITNYTPSGSSSDKEADCSKPRLLYVDDSQLMRAAAKKIFRNHFDIIIAEDGVEGLDIVNSDPNIQLVVSDVVMPNMDGFEFLRQVRQSQNSDIRNLPIIMATDMGNSESARKIAFDLGATDFVPKPFVGSEILERAQVHTARRKNTQRLERNTTIDPGTGLLNKRGMRAQLDRDLAYTQRHSNNLTVLIFEFDCFKELFVQIGRRGTEKVIRKVGRVLNKAVRKEDSVARIGLATFMVSMPGAKDEYSKLLSERICSTVESIKARLDNVYIKITVSVGVCSTGEQRFENLDVDGLWKGAKYAVDTAAEKGRSQIHCISINEYLDQCAESRQLDISLDELVRLAAAGEYEQALPHLDKAIEQLAPLLSLMSNEQRQRVITLR